MQGSTSPQLKKNVSVFSEDAEKNGHYGYHIEKLSCQIANARILRGIEEAFPFPGKVILDVGCGDGTNSLLYAVDGAKFVLGLDPAEGAIKVATQKAKAKGLDDRVAFEACDLYAFELDSVKEAAHGLISGERKPDLALFNGVLHHLPDPATAIMRAGQWSDSLLLLEPNGMNPILKLLERFSSYHIEHEEKSYTAGQLAKWCRAAGYTKITTRYINLTPMFCPDWMAAITRFLTPIYEWIPLIRNISCGQIVMLCQKG